METNIDQNWTNEDGTHAGGVSTGIGYTISWQRGSLNEAGRNGAFLIEVLKSCQSQLSYFQNSKYKCEENEKALQHLQQSIQYLEARKNRRLDQGTLGTTKPDDV